MKLYLSSYRIPTPDDLYKLVGKQPQDISVAFITNSKDSYPPEEARAKLTQTLDFMASIKLRCTTIDLRTIPDADVAYSGLQEFDIIWAWGGNTFVLLYEMKRSGFDKAIRKLLDEGKVYGGESAGAIVAGTSLRGIEFADNPEHAKEVIWDGMSLIDKAIIPHVDSPEPKYVERLPEFLKAYENNLDDLIQLADNEAYIVNGSSTQKVSAPYIAGTHDVDYSH